MLQRLRISTKLAILVAIPLVSLVLLGLVAAQTLQQVRIGGKAYSEIGERKDIIADVNPPALYLVEADLGAHELAQTVVSRAAGVSQQREELRLKMDRLHKEYRDRHDYWKSRLSAGDPVGKVLIQDSLETGDEFWRIYDEEFVPALEAAVKTGSVATTGDQFLAATQPLNASLEVLGDAYAVHRADIDRVVELATADLRQKEADANELTRQQAILLAGAGLAIVLIVAAAGSLVARSISNPIRRLTEAANESAATKLPELVHTVRELPAGAELPAIEPFPAEASEELRLLAQSFDSLRRTAVELAAGEAQLRQNVSAMFVNLGRRNQNLLNRTLTFISTLEENERNPDTLDNLFRLDHLVTRMRRNAESLLVLAGTEAARTWSEPVEIGDVVRGALSEIEAYDRVDISLLEPVDVRGNVAADVSHMLAEMLENATTFSPPSAPVTVIGKYAHDGYLISITDNGIGMTSKELRESNARLGEAGKFDTSPLMVLGLFVVSRLAARHGIHVKLAESPSEGVTAKVMLPLDLLEGTNIERHALSPDEALPAPVADPAASSWSVEEPVVPVVDLLAGLGQHAPFGAEPFVAEPPASPAVPAAPVAPAPVAPASVAPAPLAPVAPAPAVAPAGPAPAVPIMPEAPLAPPTMPAAPVAPAPVAAAPVAPVAPVAEPVPTFPAAGTVPVPAAPAEAAPSGARELTRRRPGAQMPDTGPSLAGNPESERAPERSPEDVRQALASFQGGVEYGRNGDGLPVASAAEAPVPSAAAPSDATPAPAVDVPAAVETPAALAPIAPAAPAPVAQAAPAPVAQIAPPVPVAPAAAVATDAPTVSQDAPPVPAVAEVAQPSAVQPAIPVMPLPAPVAETAAVAANEPTPAPAPHNGTPAAADAAAANGGLTRRVKGAQMVDTGPDTLEATPASQRSADDVRAALSSFQQGTTLAATEVSHNHGKQ